MMAVTDEPKDEDGIEVNWWLIVAAFLVLL